MIQMYAEGMALGLVMPILVALLTHIVLRRLLKIDQLPFPGSSVYRYSKGTIIFVSIMAMVLIVLFAYAGATMRHPFRQSGETTVFAYGAVLWAHYMHQYRVVVSDAFIQAGAFRLSTVYFKNIVRAVYRRGARGGGSVRLYGDDRKRVTLWTSVDDFDTCLKEVKSRLPAGVRVEGYQ